MLHKEKLPTSQQNKLHLVFLVFYFKFSGSNYLYNANHMRTVYNHIFVDTAFIL